MNWEIIFVIPNINISKPIESEFIVIAPSDDKRITNFKKRSPESKYLIHRFKDQFNRKITPSFLIIREDAPKRFRYIDALIDFRNIFAINIILYGWQNILRSPNVLYPLYADFFKFYPIILSKHNDGYLTNSAALSDWNTPNSFHGQIDAGLNNFQINDLIPDKELFSFLMNSWKLIHLKRHKSEQKYNSVFRSLEMAMQALLVPFLNYSIHEPGTRMALWISSFEILTQAALLKPVYLIDVLSFMEKIDWKDKRLTYKYYKGIKKYPKINLPQKIYYDLYSARNDFLHGNPITRKKIFLFNNTKFKPLTFLAPVIYRMFLITYLKKVLNFDQQERILSWSKSYFEEAILSSRTRKNIN